MIYYRLKTRDRVEHIEGDHVRQYVNVKAGTNWHTPGHNGGRACASSPFLCGFHDTYGQAIFRTDLSVSVESLGDLSSPEGRTPLSEAQKLTSEIFGTAQSRYVTNGTSTSNSDPLAIERNRAYSLRESRPLPYAMFDGIDTTARRN